MNQNKSAILMFFDIRLNSKIHKTLLEGEKKGYISMDEVISALPPGDTELRFSIFDTILQQADSLGIPIKTLSETDKDKEKQRKNFPAQKWVHKLTDTELFNLGDQILDLLN